MEGLHSIDGLHFAKFISGYKHTMDVSPILKLNIGYNT